MTNIEILIDILNAHYYSDNYEELSKIFIKYYDYSDDANKVVLMELLFKRWYCADLVDGVMSHLNK